MKGLWLMCGEQYVFRTPRWCLKGTHLLSVGGSGRKPLIRSNHPSSLLWKAWSTISASIIIPYSRCFCRSPICQMPYHEANSNSNVAKYSRRNIRIPTTGHNRFYIHITHYHATSHHSIPHHTRPHYTIPHQTTTRHTTPQHDAPHCTKPHDTTNPTPHVTCHNIENHTPRFTTHHTTHTTRHTPHTTSHAHHNSTHSMLHTTHTRHTKHLTVDVGRCKRPYNWHSRYGSFSPHLPPYNTTDRTPHTCHSSQHTPRLAPYPHTQYVLSSLSLHINTHTHAHQHTKTTNTHTHTHHTAQHQPNTTHTCTHTYTHITHPPQSDAHTYTNTHAQLTPAPSRTPTLIRTSRIYIYIYICHASHNTPHHATPRATAFNFRQQNHCRLSCKNKQPSIMFIMCEESQHLVCTVTESLKRTENLSWQENGKRAKVKREWEV